MKGKPLGSLLFFSLAELYFLLTLAIGIWEKKIPVMLGHFDYGDAVASLAKSLRPMKPTWADVHAARGAASTTWCSWQVPSKSASVSVPAASINGKMRYLEARGVAFDERDVSAPDVAEEAKSRYGVRVAPITVIDGEALSLYGTFAEQKSRLDAAFGG